MMNDKLAPRRALRRRTRSADPKVSKWSALPHKKKNYFAEKIRRGQEVQRTSNTQADLKQSPNSTLFQILYQKK